jgi:mutator protein MutT
MTETAVPHKIIGVAVIWNDAGQILIDRRKSGGKMGGLWEFPGGKVEPGESIETCVAREVQEELGIQIAVGESLMTIVHDYTEFVLTLHVHHCRHISGKPQTIECDEIRWVMPEELSQFTFPEANAVIIQALQARSV